MFRCTSCICDTCHPVRPLDTCTHGQAAAAAAAPPPAPAAPAAASSSWQHPAAAAASARGAATPTTGPGGARTPTQGPPAHVVRQLDEMHAFLRTNQSNIQDINAKLDGLVMMMPRVGRHLDRVEEKVDKVQADLEELHKSIWQGQWAIEVKVDEAILQAHQVKAGIAVVQENVDRVNINVDQVRADLTLACNVGGWKPAPTGATEPLASDNQQQEGWGTWEQTVASGDGNQPDAAAGAGLQIDEAEVLNIQNVDMASAATATNEAS